MKIKIKKLCPEAVIPKYAKQGDAGLDLTAVSKVYDKYGNVSYGTGLAFEIPEGFFGMLFPRSSNCKQDLLLSNSVGILDSKYRGEVIFKFKPSVIFTDNNFGIPEDTMTFDSVELSNEYGHTDYSIGDRIGQLIIMPYPQIEFEQVDSLEETERGVGGFGSTNN